jgi:transposase InsO family protein
VDFVSLSGAGSIWLRHGLASMQQRLRVLEEKSAVEGLVLTEALEKKRHDDGACGEIETAHPGYLGSQDTFCLGAIKGAGRICRQVFADACSKRAAAKLYTAKTPITGADSLNDGIGIIRMLTDRGSECRGKVETHDYELYLGVNNMEHSKTKARHPQTNGICERFHKTVRNEFYEVAFRRKRYGSLEELQTVLDVWMDDYNNNRTRQGKMCRGKTPMQTFMDGKSGWQKKEANLN